MAISVCIAFHSSSEEVHLYVNISISLGKTNLLMAGEDMPTFLSDPQISRLHPLTMLTDQESAKSSSDSKSDPPPSLHHPQRLPNRLLSRLQESFRREFSRSSHHETLLPRCRPNNLQILPKLALLSHRPRPKNHNPRIPPRSSRLLPNLWRNLCRMV